VLQLVWKVRDVGPGIGSRDHVNGIRGVVQAAVERIGMEDAPCTSEHITTGTRKRKSLGEKK